MEHPGEGAMHERSRAQYSEISVQIFDLGFGGRARIETIKHLTSPWGESNRSRGGATGKTEAAKIVAPVRKANPDCHHRRPRRSSARIAISVRNWVAGKPHTTS